jgi:hypothetical protein
MFLEISKSLRIPSCYVYVMSVSRMWNHELDRASIMNKNPSLLKVLVKCFGPKSLLLGLILSAVEIIFR